MCLLILEINIFAIIQQWNDELAYFAELNVKQCQMNHDACHNTEEFHWSGQNLAGSGSTLNINIEKAISDGITRWYNEYKDAAVADIDSYPSKS